VRYQVDQSPAVSAGIFKHLQTTTIYNYLQPSTSHLQPTSAAICSHCQLSENSITPKKTMPFKFIFNLKRSKQVNCTYN
jgi:hypothetical protein